MICADCRREMRTSKGRGLCSVCHLRNTADGTISRYPTLRQAAKSSTPVAPIRMCAGCKTRPVRGWKLCGACRIRNNLTRRRTPRGGIPRWQPADPDWRERAACFGRDPEWWFTTGDNRRTTDEQYPATAIQLCETCPVSYLCLAEALRHDDCGLRGGLSETQRRNMPKELRRELAGQVAV